MTDREERQHVIEVLQNMVDWMQEIDDIATPERIHALFYAISSIKTDLKYDLLYEETSGQADKPTTKNDLGVASGLEKNSKKLENPTAKNDLGVDYLGVDCISRSDVLKLMQDNWHTHNGDWAMQESMDDIRALPPATPQEPILDKIREQIKSHLRGVEITLEVLVENDPLRPKMEGAKDTLEECLEIIDKAESEG